MKGTTHPTRHGHSVVEEGPGRLCVATGHEAPTEAGLVRSPVGMVGPQEPGVEFKRLTEQFGCRGDLLGREEHLRGSPA